MDSNHIIFAVIFGVFLLIAAASVVRGWLATARLNGMKIVADAMIRGIGHHYERQNEQLPEEVEKAIDDMKARVARHKNDRYRAEQYVYSSRMLADAMGQACVNHGIEIGRHWSEPMSGNIRVDLSEREVLNLAFLADMGFERMIGRFADEQDAERASQAIEQLERHKPKDTVDQSDPYAQSFNRQTMIWNRWPKKPAGSG
jgi:hypothetical protein